MTETNTHRRHRMLMKARRTLGTVLSASLGFAGMVCGITPAIAQMPSDNATEEWTTPQTRLRPVGAPSAVDAYRNDTGSTVSPTHGSGFLSDPLAPVQVQAQASTLQSTSVRQAVMMQSASDSSAVPPPSLPSGGFAPPSSGGLPAPLTSTPPAGPIMAPQGTFDTTPLPRGGSAINTMPAPPSLPTQPAPATIAPGTLAPVPRGGMVGPTMSPGFSGSDYAPMTPPQIDSGFATLGNCRNISAPSGYRSDRIQTCGPATGYVTPVAATTPVYAPPPAQLGPPVFLPPAPVTQPGMPPVSSQAIIPGSPGYRPLVSFGQERYPVQVGQGIFGQPTAYVPGQKFRNMIRYVTW
jgi:hypothetical protein